jgi:hypothetical protein
MYLEFFILIADYFKSLNKRVALYEWIFPLFFGVCIFTILFYGENSSATKVFKDNSINLLGILAGFSITIITILTTGHSKNLENIKKKMTTVKIGKNTISLFQLLLINFTYSVILETFLIIFCLTYPIFLSNFIVPLIPKIVIFSVLVFLIVHVLLLTIRNLTDFYLIITRPEKKANA